LWVARRSARAVRAPETLPFHPIKLDFFTLPSFSLGSIGNSIVGVLGGAAAGALTSHVGALGSSDTAGNVGGSAVGGAILMGSVGAIKNATAWKGTA
jgi:hypothetical protein